MFPLIFRLFSLIFLTIFSLSHFLSFHPLTFAIILPSHFPPFLPFCFTPFLPPNFHPFCSSSLSSFAFHFPPFSPFRFHALFSPHVSRTFLLSYSSPVGPLTFPALSSPHISSHLSLLMCHHLFPHVSHLFCPSFLHSFPLTFLVLCSSFLSLFALHFQPFCPPHLPRHLGPSCFPTLSPLMFHTLSSAHVSYFCLTFSALSPLILHTLLPSQFSLLFPLLVLHFCPLTFPSRKFCFSSRFLPSCWVSPCPSTSLSSQALVSCVLHKVWQLRALALFHCCF